MPPFPKIRSIRSVERITKYTHTMFSASARTMLMGAYSARNESKAVKAPAPAINGNAKGKSLACSIGHSYFNISIYNTISKAIKKMTMAPAMAKEAIST